MPANDQLTPFAFAEVSFGAAAAVARDGVPVILVDGVQLCRAGEGPETFDRGPLLRSLVRAADGNENRAQV